MQPDPEGKGREGEIRMQQLKVVFLGEGGSGKTVFARTGRWFERKYIPTIGVEATSRVFFNHNLVLNIWDTAGQEKFGGLRDDYLTGADLVVIIHYDKRFIQNDVKLAMRVRPDTPILFLGSKKDVPGSNYHPCTALTFSSLTGSGVEEAWDAIITACSRL